jgi:hypothetical protein
MREPLRPQRRYHVTVGRSLSDQPIEKIPPICLSLEHSWVLRALRRNRSLISRPFRQAPTDRGRPLHQSSENSWVAKALREQRKPFIFLLRNEVVVPEGYVPRYTHKPLLKASRRYSPKVGNPYGPQVDTTQRGPFRIRQTAQSQSSRRAIWRGRGFFIARTSTPAPTDRQRPILRVSQLDQVRYARSLQRRPFIGRVVRPIPVFWPPQPVRPIEFSQADRARREIRAQRFGIPKVAQPTRAPELRRSRDQSRFLNVARSRGRVDYKLHTLWLFSGGAADSYTVPIVDGSHAKKFLTQNRPIQIPRRQRGAEEKLLQQKPRLSAQRAALDFARREKRTPRVGRPPSFQAPERFVFQRTRPTTEIQALERTARAVRPQKLPRSFKEAFAQKLLDLRTRQPRDWSRASLARAELRRPYFTRVYREAPNVPDKLHELRPRLSHEPSFLLAVSRDRRPPRFIRIRREADVIFQEDVFDHVTIPGGGREVNFLGGGREAGIPGGGRTVTIPLS